MKSAIGSLLLFACVAPAVAATVPSQLAANGQWQGRGVQVGNAFTACAAISPHMDDTLVHLRLELRFDEQGRAPIKSEAFLAMLGDGEVEGVSFDNQTNSFQVSGRHDRNGMQTQWSRHGSPVGRSAWHLSEDGQRLTFQTFGLMPDGRVLEIGAVEFSRAPDGTTCGKAAG
jgi:hypothetical protein